jgi:rRNA-processing protein FCF1
MLLRPGKTCDEAIRFFDTMQWDPGLTNVRNSIPRFGEPNWATADDVSAMLRYTDWTATAAKQIREIVDDPAVVARPRSQAYWLITGSNPTEPRTMSMLHTEIQEISTFFMECANSLRVQKERFRDYVGHSLVLDTNDFLHYQRFDQIRWIARYGDHTRIVIPHVVVDEIDRKSYEAGEKFPKRARAVYRVLEGYLDDIDTKGSAILPDGSMLEILADEPGHRRLPNNDDEVVARAAFLQQAIAPHDVIVITRDIGMRTRARTRLLKAEKLNDKYLIQGSGLSARELDKAVASIGPGPPMIEQADRGSLLPDSNA